MRFVVEGRDPDPPSHPGFLRTGPSGRRPEAPLDARPSAGFGSARARTGGLLHLFSAQRILEAELDLPDALGFPEARCLDPSPLRSVLDSQPMVSPLGDMAARTFRS